LLKILFIRTKWVIQNNKVISNSGFYFKWVQCLKDIDYSRFKEGTQLVFLFCFSNSLNYFPQVNHIQNIKIIASKTGLHQTLTDFETKEGGNRISGLRLSEFYPLTYLFILNFLKPI